MYVAKVKLENIRGFHDARKVDLDLARPDGTYPGWTVVTGPSGSGRSTFLRALALAIAGPSVAPALLSGSAAWVSHGKDQGGIELDLVSAPDDPFTRGFVPPEEHVFADLVLTSGGISAESNVGRNGPWQDNPSGWLAVGYGAFRRPSGTAVMTGPRLQARLSGLFRDQTVLPEGVPQPLRDTVVSLLSDGLLPGDFTFEGDALYMDGHPLRELGDGFRSTVGLIVDLLRHIHAAYGAPSLSAPGVVLIDEVETHLHLAWQQWIGGWLKEHFPAIQFIVTTNSPYVCQAADPHGLVLLPAAQEQAQARIIDGDLYDRIVFGSGDDAALSELFGLDSPYTASAQRLRQELVDLEIKVLDGLANEVQLARYRELQELLVSSPATRALEIADRLQKEKARRGRK
ncbi:AAA family ATPase [Catelliglobosispora koreensis]|uniref:AAA family ATPase n=1 Tax=Catelliglobosispora koreensis TaxID=129052 RepID=UPI00035D4AA1|nr:AAA family ATPase [Catelliglobosispora koreensis]